MAKGQGRWEKRKVGIVMAEYAATREPKFIRRFDAILEKGTNQEVLMLVKTIVLSQPQKIENKVTTDENIAAVEQAKAIIANADAAKLYAQALRVAFGKSGRAGDSGK